jgi:hypothetical protein
MDLPVEHADVRATDVAYVLPQHALVCHIGGVEISTTAPPEIAAGRQGRCRNMGALQWALGPILVAAAR